MSNSTCVLSCSDSGLSTAANVIGILTFAGGVLGAMLLNARLVANSTSELCVLIEDFEYAERQFRMFKNRLHKYGPLGLPMEHRLDEVQFREFEDLDHMLERAGGLVHDARSRIYKINIHHVPKRWEAVKISLKGLKEQGELTALLKKTQSMLREVQLRTMQFEQDQMRQSLEGVNDDLRLRSNALFEMLLEQRGKFESTAATPQAQEVEKPLPDFGDEDIMSKMARIGCIVTDIVHHSGIPRLGGNSQAVEMCTQNHDEGAGQQEGDGGRNREPDPLGTLLRSVTMSTINRDVAESIAAREIQE
ncbi:hypothetical protein DL95DRAFT_502711 [Leptodontidium sp. 2 PMI_412]|nr:hypothetical protein DL95DRAFT_502711 [Leptodontidium sp. 2 PMI_412]